MNIFLSRSTFCKTLIAASLVLGLNAAVYADSTDAPQPHSDGIGAVATDTVITTKVKSQFIDDGRLKKSDISVATTNGVVTLTGTATSAAAKTAAESIASSVSGVKSVDDQLKAPSAADVAASKVDKAAVTTKKAVSDSWITTKVKSEILADSVSKGFKVGVKTVHGVVVLKGSLGNQDAIDHVKDLASQVNGVKSVDTSALVVAST
ncbi:MAG: hypothetical protein JWR07_3067 [Nevskia sp.]|nr:hypothetical protein [Nevskia sp.]